MGLTEKNTLKEYWSDYALHIFGLIIKIGILYSIIIFG